MITIKIKNTRGDGTMGEETEILEFKTSTAEIPAALDSIVAILNKHQKGTLYFGVKNNGTPIGQQMGAYTLRDISRAITDHIEPKICIKGRV